jgi:hypothetical protein
MRLDPFSLPVRYRANDAGADERVRLVELDRERVVMRRAVRGIRMEVSTPVKSFLGVALRIVPPEGEFDGAVAITLEHRDPGLTVPLFVAADGREVAVEWQVWARVLGLPQLVAEADGSLRDPFAGAGGLRLASSAPRRRGRATMRQRRPRLRKRRKAGTLPISGDGAVVHSAEREIIARD